MTTTTYSTDSRYSAAKTLSGSIAIGGNTFANKDWLKAQGARWDADRKEWTLRVPGGNAATASLLHSITSRGMGWRAR